MKERFEQYAEQGKHFDAITALSLLTKAYISQCGISLTVRTVVYCAAEQWQELLAWEDSDLAVKARRLLLFQLMPLLTDEYDPDIYDEYDIDGLSVDEMYHYTLSIIADEEFDEETNKVLCRGIKILMEPEEFQPYNIEKTITDSLGNTIVLFGIVKSQCVSNTSVEMLLPFQIDGFMGELIKDASVLLEVIYRQYLLILSKESEIRAAYSSCLDLITSSSYNRHRRRRIVRQVFYSLFDEEIVVDIEEIVEREFGLKITPTVL